MSPQFSTLSLSFCNRWPYRCAQHFQVAPLASSGPLLVWSSFHNLAALASVPSSAPFAAGFRESFQPCWCWSIPFGETRVFDTVPFACWFVFSTKPTVLTRKAVFSVLHQLDLATPGSFPFSVDLFFVILRIFFEALFFDVLLVREGSIAPVAVVLQTDASWSSHAALVVSIPLFISELWVLLAHGPERYATLSADDGVLTLVV